MPKGRFFPLRLAMYMRLVGCHRKRSSRMSAMSCSILASDIPSAVSFVTEGVIAPWFR